MCEKFVLLHFTNALKILGMVSLCFSQMSSQQFNELPNSTKAVGSYNRFGRSVHRQPLKVAMMASYRRDMAKSFVIMARGRGLLTSYEDQTPTGRDKRSKQQNSARRKRLRYTDALDNTMGPPDKRANFISGNTVNTHIHVYYSMHFLVLEIYSYILCTESSTARKQITAQTSDTCVPIGKYYKFFYTCILMPDFTIYRSTRLSTKSS